MLNKKSCLVLLVSIIALGAFSASAANFVNTEENVFQIKSSTETIEKTNLADSQKGFLSESYDGFLESFSKDLSLNVVLGDVILLVLIVNMLALFNKPRLIILVSYVFSLKWTFWSNFNTVWHHSSAVMTVSTTVFFICGLLTVFLYCMNRFEEPS